MAKRRKRKMGAVRRKRSSMNGNMTSILTSTLSVVAGAVAAGYLNKIIPAATNQKLVAGGKIALGIALPMLSKNGSTKNLLSGVGAGMIAVGSIDLLKDFGVLSGDFDLPVVNGDVLAGDDDFFSGDVLAGDDIPVINGDDDYMGEDDYMNGDDFMNGDDDL